MANDVRRSRVRTRQSGGAPLTDQMFEWLSMRPRHAGPGRVEAEDVERGDMKRICGILFGATFLLGSNPAWSLETRTVAAGNWHNSGTWSAGVPRPGDTALISHKVTANRNVVCTGAGQWTFGAGSGLTFQGVNEAAFVGGGMDPIATDIGLWIMDRCRLVVAGTPKTAWTRLAGGAVAGATTLTLAAAPTNWQGGDTIIITPTEHPNVGSRAEKGFEQRTIAAIRRGQDHAERRPLPPSPQQHEPVHRASLHGRSPQPHQERGDQRRAGRPLTRLHPERSGDSPQHSLRCSAAHGAEQRGPEPPRPLSSPLSP